MRARHVGQRNTTLLSFVLASLAKRKPSKGWRNILLGFGNHSNQLYIVGAGVGSGGNGGGNTGCFFSEQGGLVSDVRMNTAAVLRHTAGSLPKRSGRHRGNDTEQPGLSAMPTRSLAHSSSDKNSLFSAKNPPRKQARHPARARIRPEGQCRRAKRP